MLFFAGIFTILYLILSIAFYIWGFALILKILNVMPIAEYTWGSLLLIGILIFISAVIIGTTMKILLKKQFYAKKK